MSGIVGAALPLIASPAMAQKMAPPPDRNRPRPQLGTSGAMSAVFFKGTREGAAGDTDKLVRKMTNGPYSHSALLFSDGVLGEATNVDDAGVRFRANLVLSSKDWDFVELSDFDEAVARAWFTQHEGAPYDYNGAMRMTDSSLKQDPNAWYCSEACTAALGLPRPWATSSNSLYVTLTQGSSRRRG